MSNKELHENEDYDEDDLDFNEDDYGFIISADGELKSLMIPEFLMEDPPKSVKKILKILGIKDVHNIEPRTLH